MKTVVLMPVKNEDWILDVTLSAADQIADHILVADQESTDGTAEILKKWHPKVEVIQNTRTGHSNEVRWDLLDEARKRYGHDNLLLNIDADEILPPIHFLPLKNKIEAHVEPGKVWIASPWIQIWRSVNTFRNDNSVWSPVTNKKPFAIVDDGKVDYVREFVVNDHTSRVPGHDLSIMHTNVPLLHFQFANWQRTQEKQAWYRCRELILGHGVGQINQKYLITKNEDGIQYGLVPKKWYEGLSNVTSKIEHNSTSSWYVVEIQNMFEEYGKEFFKDLDIWHVKEIKERNA